jgi:hypothetical protein
VVARSEETPSVLSSGESVETKLRRIAEKVRKEPEFKFTSLFHLMDEDMGLERATEESGLLDPGTGPVLAQPLLDQDVTVTRWVSGMPKVDQYFSRLLSKRLQ